MSKFTAQIDGTVFKALIDSVKLLSKEARLLIDKDGFETVCVDEANVCMLDAKLHKEAFLYLDEDEPFELGVPIEELSKYVSGGKVLTLGCSSNSILTMAQDKYNFDIRLLDVDSIRKIKIPKIASSVEFDIPGAKLKELINICRKINSDIVFEANKDQVKINCTGDLTKMRLEEVEISNYQYTEDAHTMFDIDYISILGNMIPSTLVHMTLKSNYPSKISAKFADEKGDMVILLAPRVEMDE